MFKLDPYDKRHAKNLAELARKIEELYRTSTIQLTAIGVGGELDVRGWYLFDTDPVSRQRAEEVLKQLHDDIVTATEDAQERSVEISVEKSVDMAVYANWLTDERLQGINQRAFSALQSFQQRKTAGLNLSDRVWNLTDQFKQEMELGLQCGIADGVPASKMARALRLYLNEPNKLFRRVRDENGVLRLSKAAKAYHPGQGVYRSSYKNALRVTRTETNIAYRTADSANWSKFDFILGIKVQTSQSNHEVSDICDQLAGVYPRDFKFVGWHPNCRCHAVPILKTREEMKIDDERILEGKDPLPSKNEVKDLPDNFKQWIKDNDDRIKRADALGKTPYFVRDNRSMIYDTPPRQLTTLERAKIRHDARTKAEIESIRMRWNERKAVHKYADKIIGFVGGIPDVDTQALQLAMMGGDLLSIQTEAKKLAEVGKQIKNLKYVNNPIDVAKSYSYADAVAVNDSVMNTIEKWLQNNGYQSVFDNLEHSIKKLEQEIQYVSTNKKYNTWSVAADSYNKILKNVKDRKFWADASDALADLKGYKTKSSIYKQLLADAEQAISTKDRATYDKTLLDLKNKKQQLEKAKANKNTTPNPTGDKDVDSVLAHNPNVQSKATQTDHPTFSVDKIESIKISAQCTDAEALDYYAAVNGFSFQWDYEIRQVQIGNKVVSRHGHTLPDICKKANDIEDFISRSPQWRKTETMRGMSLSDKDVEDLRSALQSGDFSNNGCASWTTKRYVSEQFSRMHIGETSQKNGDILNNRVLLICDKHKSATSIKNWSQYKGEDEVLASKNCRYKLLSESRSGGFIIFRITSSN